MLVSVNSQATRAAAHAAALRGARVLVPRVDLDQRLAEAAQVAGARILTGSQVIRVDATGSAPGQAEVATVRTRTGSVFHARCVVSADGSASRLGEYVGARCSPVDLGIETEIPVPPLLAKRWAGRIALDRGRHPGSYGWVFPKNDSLSVGVTAARENKAETRGYFDRFVAQVGLAEFRPAIRSGHLTRCRHPDSPRHRGRVLVAGDAAGLLEPWTREGISFALRSGRLAGQYAARIACEAGSAMSAGAELRKMFETCPWLFHAAVTALPAAWACFTDFTYGYQSFDDLLTKHKLGRTMVKALGPIPRALTGSASRGSADAVEQRAVARHVP